MTLTVDAEPYRPDVTCRFPLFTDTVTELPLGCAAALMAVCNSLARACAVYVPDARVMVPVVLPSMLRTSELFVPLMTVLAATGLLPVMEACCAA